MDKENNLQIIKYTEDDKSLEKMVESIKMNYAIMLLLKFGTPEHE